jgi:hypothetical protein
MSVKNLFGDAVGGWFFSRLFCTKKRLFLYVMGLYMFADFLHKVEPTNSMWYCFGFAFLVSMIPFLLIAAAVKRIVS